MPKTYTEEDLKKEIREQYQLSKQFLDPIHEKMNLQEELYRTYIDKNEYPHSARVFDPRIFRVIETVTPRMVASEPTGSFYPREAGDEITTHILNALVKYDWQKANMFEKLTKFVKSMLIFGTAFGRVYWDFKESDRTRMLPKKVNGRTVWSFENKEKIKVVTIDNPNFEVLNIYDCFPDPNATDLETMRWFIYRRFKTLKELKEENETRGGNFYQHLDEIEAKIKNKETNLGAESDAQFREHRRQMMNTQEFIGKDTSNPDIVILRRYTKDYWCDYLPEYDLVIREMENPYFHNELPIVYGVDYPYPNELYGMGEIEPIDRIQRAINAVLNQRLDNVQLTLNQMWKVRKNGGVDLHTLVSAPGNIVTTDDMSAIEAISVPDVTGSTFVQTMNYLTSALQSGSGITDYTVGLNSQVNVANKTATGARLIQQEANAQFKLKIQLFTKMVIERIANQWKDLRIQYTTEEQTLRIIGRDLVKYLKDNTELGKIDLEGNPIIPGDLETQGKVVFGKNDSFAFLKLFPEDLQPSIVGDYDFIATISSEALNDPIAMQNNFFLALDRLINPAWTQGLMTQGKQLNYEALTEDVIEKLNLGIEVDKVMTDIQTPEQQQTEPPMTPDDITGMVNQREDVLTGLDPNQPIV